MKLKKILAVTIGATLALSTALALTACGDDEPKGPTDLGTTTLSIDNYVTQLSEETSSAYSGKKTVSIAQISEAGEVLDNNMYSAFLIFRKGGSADGTYRVYSVNSAKTLENNLTVKPVVTGTSLRMLRLATGEGEEVRYTYKATDGTTLLPADKYLGTPTTISAQYYVNGEVKQSTVWTVAAEKKVGEKTEKVFKYYRENTDKKTGVITYTSVDASALKYQASDDFDEGKYDKGMSKVFPTYQNMPVEGDLAEYKGLTEGKTIKFYKNGEQTGEVNLDGAAALNYVGNYLYYYTELPVSPEATSGYNYVEYKNSGAYKFDYHLYRYDILANTVSELNYNV